MDENRVAPYTEAEYKHSENFMRKQGIDVFHSDAIKLLSQNSKDLRILIHTRLKINKK